MGRGSGIIRRQMGLNEAAANEGPRSVPAGQVQLKVSAEALKTDLLCGNEVATVPKTGQVDTVVRTLLVEVGNSASTPPVATLLLMCALLPPEGRRNAADGQSQRAALPGR